MITEITKCEISNDEIKLTGNNLESLLTEENLFEDAETEEVTFVFSRDEHRLSNMKYLYKVVSSQKKCLNCKSMGEKLENLVGCIISLSENFIER